MENTFDINSFSEDRLAEAASWKQCRGLSLKFAKDSKTQKMDWRKQKQILGCLFGLSKEKKLSFKQANLLFSKNVLPKAFFNQIDAYVKKNS